MFHITSTPTPSAELHPEARQELIDKCHDIICNKDVGIWLLRNYGYVSATDEKSLYDTDMYKALATGFKNFDDYAAQIRCDLAIWALLDIGAEVPE